ncbi:hypothetical protein IQ266_23390 [filamentous cyanobacterium LEGE 11480]|uniref:Uncharacterized protein n=1 Tax=Romeriopsis navalis LEGE 11480 TaxID=2777977 RepID=A0A928VQK4_9CYAN|nr:hypothetical protein [Romeriopsis navalis]MBE9032685.1 hypothetical protein [Romeriopsis navalis LEGE 11480]
MTTTISPSMKQVGANRGIEIAKSVYQADQQVKLISLHEDAETLLQQLHALKQQRDPSAQHHN